METNDQNRTILNEDEEQSESKKMQDAATRIAKEKGMNVQSYELGDGITALVISLPTRGNTPHELLKAFVKEKVKGYSPEQLDELKVVKDTGVKDLNVLLEGIDQMFALALKTGAKMGTNVYDMAIDLILEDFGIGEEEAIKHVFDSLPAGRELIGIEEVIRKITVKVKAFIAEKVGSNKFDEELDRIQARAIETNARTFDDDLDAIAITAGSNVEELKRALYPEQFQKKAEVEGS